LRSDIAIARDFEPLTEDKINELLDKSEIAGKSGKPELYKDPTSFYGCSYHRKVLEG
jgi:hypothetical protein